MCKGCIFLVHLDPEFNVYLRKHRGKVYNITCMEHYQLSTGGSWDQIIMPHSEGVVCSHYIL